MSYIKKNEVGDYQNQQKSKNKIKKSIYTNKE